MPDVSNYIQSATLILIPVLYFIGLFIKSIPCVNDKYIPFILLAISEILCIVSLGLCYNAFIQGILVAGTTVFANQLYKQTFVLPKRDTVSTTTTETANTDSNSQGGQ